jgi:AcrR family transcriptional regulator
MSWTKNDKDRDEKDGPRGYHHGNLKEALLRAALELIAQKGPGGFTFAEAARWAGVSPAAPYRHFRDRDELLASVALRGFAQFEAVLSKSWDDGRPDVFAALERLGKAYLGFARTEPAYYSAMFEAGVPLSSNPELREAGDRAFAVLRAGADGGAAYLGDGARYRLAIRTRRRGASKFADVAGRASGSANADLFEGLGRLGSQIRPLIF